MKRTGIFKNSKQLLISLGALLLLVSVALTSGVLAKYAHTVKEETPAVTGKSFYFESNYLTADSHVYKLNAGTESVSVELYNFENERRVSEVDCSYTVSVTSEDSSVTLNGENTTELTLQATPIQTTKMVTLGGLEDGKEYTLTVVANGGYVKTLSAVFKVGAAPGGLSWEVDASDESYVILTVWTENANGNITVSVPEGLIPDNTYPALKNINNYSDGTYTKFTFSDTVGGYSSREYRFFKTSSSVDTSEFKVELE